ncbi:MAG: matrixin family metalloprotease, partial [Myxococcales bacterium]|nr:matrixin family metalloprotease [Myxococcales bacterium]
CRGSGCKQDDNGCPVSGKPLFWKSSCVGFNLQRNGSERLPLADARLAILKSFGAWSELPCPGGGNASLSFAPGEDVACKQSGYNAGGTNLNVVLFQDNDWKYRGIDGTLAKTSVTFNEETGEIYDADIEINSAFNEITVSDDKIVYDLEAIITHEVGHYIGLAHSVEENSIMAEALCEGGDRCARGKVAARRLAQDDLDAVCALYPSWATYGDDAPQGCAAAARRRGPDGEEWCVAAALSVIIGAVGALRRRRGARW